MIRVGHRKFWPVPIVAALVIPGLYDSRSAQAQTSSAVLVGAGDIASCDSPGDTATAKLLGSIAGTVVAIGDNAYMEGLAAQCNNCYDPTWGRYKARAKPVLVTTSTVPPGHRATSTTSARPRASPMAPPSCR